MFIWQSEIDYLGHIISKQSVPIDPSKLQVQAMLTWPQPKLVKELSSFLGLIGYYRKFIRNYGIISRPLNDIFKKDGFQWSESSLQAFYQLREAMHQAPVLAMPDFSKPFVVETDASGIGMEAVLQQKNHPIAFISQAFVPRVKALAIHVRKLLPWTSLSNFLSVQGMALSWL